MQLKTLSRLIAQFRDAGSNQNRIRRIRRWAATQGRDVRLQLADAISTGLLEELESRALLAGDPITANLTSGSLVISDLVGGNDSLQLTRSGSDLVITVGAGSTISTNAGTGDGTNSVAIPIASITAGVTVDAGNGNDSVTLDFTGNINFPVGVTIVDGAGTDAVNLNSDITFASSSSLVVTAESVTTAAGVDLTTSGTGAITFTADNMALNPTGTLVTPNTLTLRQKSNGMPINLGDPVFDTFTGADGSSVDSTIWQPAIGGSFALPTIQSNQARLFQRQPLNTKAQFKPGVDGTITITGQITPLASNNSDNLIVLTRSNGNTAGGSNTPSQGIGGFVQVGGGVQIYSAGVSVTGATTSSLSYTTGSTYSFSLTDTGTAITFTITEIANPSNTATVTATTATTSFPTNYVTFENREFTGFVTLLDNVNISNGVTTSSLGLSDAELDTIAASSIQIGDTNSGAITVNSVITSNTNLSLTTGSSGIVSNRGSLGTTGSTITLNTTGPIGTSANRIQFADNTNTAQQNVMIGSTNQASSVYLDGLGSLTLGSISGSTANATIDVTARAALVVAASATINSGTSPVRLGADLTAAGAGDNGTGTLTVSAGANVYGAAITLRGADEDIASTATVGSVSSVPVVGAFVGGGLNGPFGVVFDSIGNLYVSNRNNNTITQVTPAGSVSTFVSSGLSGPQGTAFDSSGNLYVANGVAGTISKVTSGGSMSTFVTGLNGPCGLAFDSSGNLYVANGGANTISKVTSGGSVSTFATGLNNPTGLAFDSSGNLYVSNFNGNSISKVTSGGSVSTFATGMSGPENLAFDSSGNLYVANYSNSTISKVTSGGSASAFVSSGLNGATGVVFDTSGNLYVANYDANTTSKVVQGAPVTTSVTLQSSVANRPLSIGGTNTAVGGINLTDAELARLFTSSTGTITFGDTAQTGDITFTTATTATTAGASTTVIQSTTGAGKIVLDDGANTGTALNGNGGVISLTAGTGGITATAANNTSAEISTTGATVTMNTTGPIGTSANRIQFADNTTATQQNVVIGSINQASSVYLDGLGSLTLGNISGGTANTTIDVTARTNLVVAAGATIISGTSSNSLGADLKADGSGDEGTGTLTIGAGSNVYGATINLRGADEAIDSTAKVGSAGIPALTTYTSSISSQPRGIAFDSSGNLYAITWSTGILYRVAPGGGSVTTIASGFVSAQGVAVDSSGNVYVCDVNGNVFKNPVGAGAKTPFVTGLGILYNMVVKGGDLYVTNYSGVKKITNLAGTPILSDYATGAASASGLAFDSSGNLFISTEGGNLYKVAANATIPAAATLINSGLNSEALAIDASDNLYLSTFGSTIRKLAPSGTGTATSIATGLNLTFGLAVDASGNVYVSDNGGNSIVKVTATIVATNQLTVRSSQPSRPIALGGGTAVAGINLSDAELGRMVTSSGGTVTIGDTAQTGDITFSTATVATSGGTSTTVIQSTAGAGKIVLDDGANTGTALNGNGGVISLTAGTGGITATAANNTSAEISTTGATVTMNTTGPIGTSANRIQFADNTNTAQQNVVIGSTNQASSVYLDGLGSLTLGSISGSTANTTIDVTARTYLVVVGSATINGGTSSVSLGADLTAAAAGDNSVGTLSIGSAASVYAGTMNLRGADVDIAGTANVGMAIAGSTTISNVISTGLNSPRGAAFDSAGNLYVANQSGAITKVTFSSPGVVNQVVTNFATVGALPDWLVFDAAGNMYSANGSGTISKITFSSPGVLGTVNNSFISTGLNAPVALAFDSTGNLFIANYGNGKVSKATFTSPGVFGTLSDFADLTSLGVTGAGSITIDPSNNLYVASNSKIVKVTPAGAASVIVASGITNDFTIAYFQGTLLAARSTTTLGQYTTSGTLLNASYATSLNTTWQTAPDSQGNLWVVNTGSNSVSKVVPNPTLTQLSLRPSVSSLPMSIGGTNNAVTGINLTDSELARIFSTSTGSIIFGDSSQTGDITFTTATVATTAGASTTIIQSTSGAGKIILDNSAGNGSALNGNSGNVSLTAGTGGIVEASTNTTAATDIVSAATTSLVSAGAIGTAILPVQIGATNLNTNSSTNNSNQFLRATGAVTIDATGVSAGTGTVTLVGGTVSLGGSNRIADATKLTVNGGTLAIGGFSDAVSTVTLKSGSITGSGGSLTSTNTTQTESGSVSAILAGSNGLTQSTAGTTTLSGANTFTGITTLSAGTLALSGASTNNIASTTSIDVQSGAMLDVTGLTSGTLVLANGQTLKGQGTVTGKITAANGSIVAPGASPGILNTGDITFNSGSTFSVEINGTSVGSLYDQVNVTGTVTIDDGNLNLSLGYVPANGDSFVIVNNDSSDPVTVTNPFKVGGSPVPEGGSFILGGNRFVLTYAGGTNNNDVVLTVQNNTAPTAVVLSPSSASLAENVSTAADTLLSTIAITDDGNGTNTLSLSGSDAASFRIVGNQLFLKAGVVLDFETRSSYSVRVNVDDTTVGGTPDAFADFTLTITDVAEDATRPSSSVNALPLNATSLSIPITVTGFDPTGIEGPASGVKEYDLYVATAGGTFSKFATVSASSPTTVFTASSNQVYYFRSIARDNAGNVELDNGADAFIRVGDFDKPVSLVTSAVANSVGLFTITATGSDTGGGRVSRFDIYVSVDGGSATLVGSANAISNSGTLTYSGIVDNASHTYRFTSRAVDTAGNTEDAHTAADVTTTATFTAPASFQGTGIDVQLGAKQRSYVRYVDVLFNDATGVNALTQANRVLVEKFGLTAADVTAGTGAAVPFTVVQIGGSNRLRLDFGVQGVGGARNSTAGDGFYRVRVDANGDGDYNDAGESFAFFRLLGDANGNAVVDALDTTVVDNLFGQIGTNLEGDLNGDGVVNTADKNFTLSRNRGRKLRDEWKSLLDD